MTDSGAVLTYGEMERRANQGAQLLRRLGLQNGQVIALWLPNIAEFFEIYWAAQRTGLYVTPVSSALTAGEALHILADSGARLLISHGGVGGLGDLLAAALPDSLEHIYCVGKPAGRLADWSRAAGAESSAPCADERPGYHMVYSSGTTGRPKGVRLPLTDGPATAEHPLAVRIRDIYRFDESTVYLSPAPLYHAAPLTYCTACHRLGATVVVMPRFDAEATLAAMERHRVTDAQMVPTMFSRLLRLPQAVRDRYDLSALRQVIHAAAPCPVDIKRQMIDWLGPIVYEYYAGSEGNGSTAITAHEWLEKPGSVGRASWGTVHVCGDDGVELPAGTPGLVYFEGGFDFQYLNDPAKTRDSRNPLHPNWSTLGDIGYLDVDGYLYLTDRKSFMIISGGVNIYPQEIENVLITHPRVADVAVLGVPHADMGEEVRAVVQPLAWSDATPEFAAELIAYCRSQLSAVKCPRAVDFDPALPRLDNGKLYKRLLRDRYWPAAAAPPPPAAPNAAWSRAPGAP